MSLALVKGDIDTDGDGVSDTEELTLGTNPADSQSVPLRSLGSWRFTDGTLNGDDGQQPIAQSNVTIVGNGFQGFGVSFPASGTVFLKYRATELSGKRNIAPIRGSILFRIKPNWDSGNNLGAAGVTVLQTTNFAVRFNSTGTSLIFTNIGTGNSLSLATPDIGSFGSAWSYCLVTYSPEQVSLEWDAPSSRVVSNWGLTPPANLNDSNQFISIGSAANGANPVDGLMDEIVAFNGVGALSATPKQISAIASNSPVGVNIVWISPTNAITEVKRRLVGATAWETAKAALGTNFFDTAVVTGERYEYNINTRIIETQYGTPDDFGRYVKGAIQGAPIHNRGKIILLVDNTLTNAIEAELGGFITNLVGDGWQILRADVPRHIDDYSSSTSFLTNYFNITNVIRPFIQSNYTAFGAEIKYILSIGHVPVAYTGTAADDGHSSSGPFGVAHTGAWASDLYFGDLDGFWTDNVTVTTSFYNFNLNYPGDGKFDQNKLPFNGLGEAKIEIPVARLDLALLPAFADSEAVLLKKYFQKNSDYRHGIRTFSAEASGSEYQLNSTHPFDLADELVSKASVLKKSVVSDVFADTRSLLFGVQSGPGAFDRINDARVEQHTTADIAQGLTTTNCAFFFLRGSYFPDWNSTNNFLRAVLATTNGGLASAILPGLTTGWRGDGLGVGYGLGNEAADVLNNWPVVANSQGIRSMEILGDPTLRYPVLASPASLSWVVTNGAVSLTWFASSGASGYYVYRSTNGAFGTFDLITATPVTLTNYTDSPAPSGSLVYMIRSSATATTGGGTFTNLSQGVFSRAITSADPLTCCIAAQTIPEDSSLAATSFSIGEAATENNLTLTATSSNTSLVPNENIILDGSGETRTVEITPTADQFGTATITIKAISDLSTIVKVFELTVNSLNDAPVFTKGGNQSVAQAAPAQTINNWATGISPGPANESSQQVTFVVTNDSSHLFSAQPSVAPDGTLTFTTDPAQRGIAQVSVQAKDDGGTANSGKDTSYPQVFTITVGLPLDTDSDGLPDDFEQYYGFDANIGGDGTGDWDGDSMTNLQEFAAGTDPKSSSSSVRISSAASQSPACAIEFTSVAGRTYAIDFNDNFPSGQWQNLASPLAGTGAVVQQVDSNAGNSNRRIYRVTTTGLNGDPLVTEYAGLCRFTCLGNSDTFISNPFLRAPQGFGSVISVNANVVQLRGAPSWQANQWVYSSGTQSNTYFMQVRSGALNGDIYTITANDSDKLTLDLQGNSLASLQPGDAVAIVPYWTLGTLFQGGTSVHASPVPSNRRTEVFFPNISGTGINLSAVSTYYFWNGAWRKIGTAGAIKNDDVIPADMYIIVRHNVDTNTVVTMEGAVLPGKFRVDIRRNLSGKQDNFIALPRPLSVSLNDSDLISSGAFRPSIFTGNRIDELFIYDNSVVLKNKSPSATYYYWNGAWRKIGTAAQDRGGDLVFQPGNAVIIRSGSDTSSAVWTNNPTY